LSDEKCEKIISSIPPEAIKKLNLENLNPKEAYKTLIKKGYNLNL